MIENEILRNYFSGYATYEEEQKILNWLDKDPNNIQILYKERAIWDLVAFNGDTFFNQSQLEATTKRKVVLARFNVLCNIAAIFLIILSIVSLYFVFYSHNVNGKESSFVSLEVPKGKIMQIDLSDGSKVWLNSKTKFKYPKSFNDNTREVVLDGEAYFEVKHDESKPFKVITSQQSINVLGTIFNVNAFAKENVFEATLMKGSISVNGNANQSDIQPIILKPGYKLLFNRAVGVYNVIAVDAKSYTLWKDGFYNFKNRAFGDIISRLQKDTDIKLMVKDTTLFTLVADGEFYRSETPLEILDVLKESMPITYEYDAKSNSIIITKSLK